MRKNRGSVVVATVWCLAACGQAVAQDVMKLSAADRAIEAKFEEVFRVGGQGAENGKALSDVTSLGFDQNGRLFIGDVVPGSGLRVVAINSDGTLVKTFGRAGQGSGGVHGCGGDDRTGGRTGGRTRLRARRVPRLRQ